MEELSPAAQAIYDQFTASTVTEEDLRPVAQALFEYFQADARDADRKYEEYLALSKLQAAASVSSPARATSTPRVSPRAPAAAPVSPSPPRIATETLASSPSTPAVFPAVPTSIPTSASTPDSSSSGDMDIVVASPTTCSTVCLGGNPSAVSVVSTPAAAHEVFFAAVAMHSPCDNAQAAVTHEIDFPSAPPTSCSMDCLGGNINASTLASNPAASIPYPAAFKLHEGGDIFISPIIVLYAADSLDTDSLVLVPVPAKLEIIDMDSFTAHEVFVPLFTLSDNSEDNNAEIRPRPWPSFVLHPDRTTSWLPWLSFTGATISLFPWNTCDYLHGNRTQLIIVISATSRSSILPVSCLFEQWWHCSSEIANIHDYLVLDVELTPWPSWTLFFWVLTVMSTCNSMVGWTAGIIVESSERNCAIQHCTSMSTGATVLLIASSSLCFRVSLFQYGGDKFSRSKTAVEHVPVFHDRFRFLMNPLAYEIAVAFLHVLGNTFSQGTSVYQGELVPCLVVWQWQDPVVTSIHLQPWPSWKLSLIVQLLSCFAINICVPANKYTDLVRWKISWLFSQALFVPVENSFAVVVLSNGFSQAQALYSFIGFTLHRGSDFNQLMTGKIAWVLGYGCSVNSCQPKHFLQLLFQDSQAAVQYLHDLVPNCVQLYCPEFFQWELAWQLDWEYCDGGPAFKPQLSDVAVRYILHVGGIALFFLIGRWVSLFIIPCWQWQIAWFLIPGNAVVPIIHALVSDVPILACWISLSIGNSNWHFPSIVIIIHQFPTGFMLWGYQVNQSSPFPHTTSSSSSHEVHRQKLFQQWDPGGAMLHRLEGAEIYGGGIVSAPCCYYHTLGLGHQRIRRGPTTYTGKRATGRWLW